MKPWFISIAIFLYLFFSPTQFLSAQEISQQTLTLQQYIDLAMHNNPQIQAGKYQVKSAEGKVGQALSFYFPILGVEAGYTTLDQDRTSTLTLPEEYYELFVYNALYLDLKRAIEREEFIQWDEYKPGTDPIFLVDAVIADVKKPVAERELDPALIAKVLPYYGAAKSAIPQSIETGYLGKDHFGTTISLTQPIFTGFEISSRYKQAVWNKELEQFKSFEAEQKVIFQICEAYYGLSQGHELLILADEMQSRFKMLRIITKALMKSRKSRKNQYDYMTIQVYANKIDLLKQQMETKVKNGKLYLQLLCGLEQQVEIPGNTQVPRVAVQTLEESIHEMRKKILPGNNWSGAG